MSTSLKLKSENCYSNWVERAQLSYDGSQQATFLDASGNLIEGIYLGMPNDVYHGLSAYSSSQLKAFYNSPAHYYREYLSDTTRKRTIQTKRTLDTGTLAHELILEPEGFYERYFRDLLPSDVPNALLTLEDINGALEKVGLSANEGKQEKLARLRRLVPSSVDKEYKTIAAIDVALTENGFSKSESKLDKAVRLMSKDPSVQVFDFIQEANRKKHGDASQTITEHGDKVTLYGGKYPIDGLVWDDAFRAYQTVQKHIEASGHLSHGLPEVAMIVKCPITGLMLKAKFDWLSFYDTAADVKTTLSASPDKFRQKIFDLNYFLQDGFYCYVSSLLGIEISTFTFIAVEFMHCNVCQPYQLSESRRKKARIELAETLAEFKWCLDHNKWYGYQKQDCTIILD